MCDNFQYLDDRVVEVHIVTKYLTKMGTMEEF